MVLLTKGTATESYRIAATLDTGHLYPCIVPKHELLIHFSTQEEGFYDPVVGAYPLHSGPITCVRVSPLEGSLMATAGEDRVGHR